MGLLGARLYVAFDASAVTGAIVQRALQGRSLRAFAHAVLPAGALDPSGTTPNLVRPEEVRDSVRRVLAAVDHAGGGAEDGRGRVRAGSGDGRGCGRRRESRSPPRPRRAAARRARGASAPHA